VGFPRQESFTNFFNPSLDEIAVEPGIARLVRQLALLHDLGGVFQEDGSLDGVMRSAAQGLTRGRKIRCRTDLVNGVPVPRDSDLERNWREDDETFGTAE
jgi:hypothetical protein